MGLSTDSRVAAGRSATVLLDHVARPGGICSQCASKLPRLHEILLQMIWSCICTLLLQTQPNSTHLPQPDALQLSLLVTRAVGACNLVLYVGCLPTLICITGGLCSHNDPVISYV